MEANPRTVESYIAPNGAAPFDDWMAGLKDYRGKAQIESRISRVRRGLVGLCRDVGDGITELKIDFGPGYRVYCVDNGVTVLLLCGGTKRTQDADIARAKQHWREYRS